MSTQRFDKALIVGSLALCLAPRESGLAGYVLPIILMTGGYAIFQAANNSAFMADAPQAHRGQMSGMLNLSRNLGLVTGASAMGAVFAIGVSTDIATARPEAIISGMRATFGIASLLVVIALTGHIRWRDRRA